MGFNRVERVQDRVNVRHVLVSVYDKAGLEDFARGLAASCPGIRFFATGGSHEALRKIFPGADRSFPHRGSEAPEPCQVGLVAVSDYTGQAEMRGGLVKTLDWKIYLGLLAEFGDEAHEADLRQSGAVAFDMVIANLYPFEAAAADSDFAASTSGPEDLRQRIDIGGPAMIRSAAKNYLRIASVSNPSQYGEILAELAGNGGRMSLSLRRRLAVAAFSLTSRFDAVVARRLDAFDSRALEAAYRQE
jgi:phosphoribosylaminoimidazolecarboxamide formyltransferase/IMP cyclohydrolase